MNAGDTFRYGQGHLFIVISDPSLDSENVVFVNMSTDRGGDQSCVLMPGDHPFVLHRTLIRYDKARIETNRTLEWLIASGAASRQDPLCPDVLEKVRRGAATTDAIPLGCKQVLIRQGIIES